MNVPEFSFTRGSSNDSKANRGVAAARMWARQRLDSAGDGVSRIYIARARTEQEVKGGGRWEGAKWADGFNR